MRVSTKSDYALRALIELARSEDVVSAESLAARQQVPLSFLPAILADLRRAGVVASQRGQFGGWRLATEPAAVSIADVIRAVDGPLLSVYGLRPERVEYNDAARILQSVWIAARSSLREVFESTTIADLAAGHLPEGVRERTVDEDAWQPR